jgi:hypothetical protein
VAAGGCEYIVIISKEIGVSVISRRGGAADSAACRTLSEIEEGEQYEHQKKTGGFSGCFFGSGRVGILLRINNFIRGRQLRAR